MAKKFSLVNLRNFRGFIQKLDKTNIGANYLVENSQNVLSTDGGRLAARRGYTVFGAEDSTLEPIESSFEWDSHRGVQHALRTHDDASTNGTMEVYTNNAWITLISSLNTAQVNFTTYWDTTEMQDAMLFVAGDSNMYYWSGGTTTFASATATTITKQGSTTWAQDAFLTTGTRSVIIEGVTYTYTGGEGTTTITGVNPDPTVAGHTVGATVLQAVRTTANTPASGYDNDIIATLKNQVYVGDTERRDVYISAVGDYTDYTFSSPRAVGEGALLTLDETPTGFAEQEQDMYISTINQWYQTRFTLSSDLQNEALQIERLKTAPQQGAISQGAIFKIKNDVWFINGESAVDSLGRVRDILTPNSRNVSDPIKSLMLSYDLTNAHGKYFEYNVYIAIPNESRVLVYNLDKQYWEAPQVLPVSRLAIIESELYGHSNSTTETYQLFEGFNDNGNPIDARANFSYLNYGRRDHKKNLTEWLTEGYISSNTEVTMTLNYDFDGFTTIKEFLIDGDNEQILFQPVDDVSLGKKSLGKSPLGSSTEELPVLAKFRQINTTPKEDFYEIQVQYSSNDVDQQWELLALGGNATISTADNNEIKL